MLAVLQRQEKRRLALLTMLNMLISIADIVSLAILLFIVAFYTQPEVPGSSLVPAWLARPGSSLLITVFLILFVVKSIAGYLIYKAQYRFVYRVASRISETKLVSYLEGNYADHVNVDSSVHIRRISHQPIEFSQYVLAGFQQIITEVVLISLSVVLILVYNARLFLLLFVILLPAIIFLTFLIRRRLRGVRANVKNSSQKSLQYLHEALSGFVDSNIYNKNPFLTRRYSGFQQTLNSYIADVQVTQGIPSRLIEAFVVFGLFILVALGKNGGTANGIRIVTIGAFMGAAYKIIPGIVRIINIGGQIRTYAFTLHDLAPDKNRAQRPHMVEKIQSFAFQQVSFGYNEKRLLINLDFTAIAGAFIGLSGNSGIGKTTVINLLLGFADPGSGQILVNGAIADARIRQSCWSRIAYVKQQPFIIHDSILRNITLDDERYCEERLRKAIKASGLEEIISSFPEGMEKVISENGKNISGGQRQRIAIARALYKEADCFILDEPFNELDHISELALLDHFRELARSGKIIILITHNRKSLVYCDKVISLDA